MNSKILTPSHSENLVESKVVNQPVTPNEQPLKPMEKRAVGRKRKYSDRNKLIGVEFGYLTLLERDRSDDKKRSIWKFQCRCGTIISHRFETVWSGAKISCGCIFIPNGFKHGLIHTREYKSWAQMIARCTNQNNHNWANYGGRGVSVCDSWRNDFMSFYTDMGLRPDGKSLDRIDVNKGYCPENCRWASQLEQSNNKRNSILVTINEKTQTLAQWSRELGLKSKNFRTLRRRGLTPTEAVAFYFKPSSNASGKSAQ